MLRGFESHRSHHHMDCRCYDSILGSYPMRTGFNSLAIYQELKPMLEYVTRKYGKDFVKLYGELTGQATPELP